MDDNKTVAIGLAGGVIVLAGLVFALSPTSNNTPNDISNDIPNDISEAVSSQPPEGSDSPSTQPPKKASKKAPTRTAFVREPAQSKDERSKRAAAWQEQARKAEAFARAHQNTDLNKPLWKNADPSKGPEDAKRVSDETARFAQKQGLFHTLPEGQRKAHGRKMKDLYDAIAAHPERVSNYVKLARLQKEAQLHELAIKTLADALQLEPNNTQVLLERGRIFHSFGYRRQAEIAYEKILAIDPDNEVAQGYLEDVQKRFDYHPGDRPR